MPKVDSTSKVHATAELAEDVVVGPGSVIGAHVKIGAGTRIREHVIIRDYTEIGCHNDIFQFNSIGEIPQDKKYHGEKAKLIIGDNNKIREFCTLHSGTNPHTAIGNNNLIMAYVHIAHDCRVGDHCIFVNNATLAGHVQVGQNAVIGAFCKVHQFCRIGEYSFTRHLDLGKDLLPYVIAAGIPAKTYGINKIGLQRAGFDAETIAALKKCYSVLVRKGTKRQDELDAIAALAEQYAEVKRFVEFAQNSERGILR